MKIRPSTQIAQDGATSGQALLWDGSQWTPTSLSAGFTDPTTTKGDLIVHGASTTRLGIGTDGQVLTADSTQALGVKWATPTGNFIARDRTVATAGNNKLTLGATPITNSPLVWKNGTLLWPGVDYTISGNIITFGTALSAGDVITDYYTYTSGTAGAATLSGGAAQLIEQQSVKPASGGSFAVTLANPTQTGDVIVVLISTDTVNASTDSVSGLGATWTRRTQIKGAGNINPYFCVWTGLNPTAGQTALTLAGTNPSAIVMLWRGLSGTVVATGTGQGSGTSLTSGTATPTAAGQLVVGGWGQGDFDNPTYSGYTAGWTPLTKTPGGWSPVGGGYIVAADTTAKTLTATSSLSRSCAGGIIILS